MDRDEDGDRRQRRAIVRTDVQRECWEANEIVATEQQRNLNKRPFRTPRFRIERRAFIKHERFKPRSADPLDQVMWTNSNIMCTGYVEP